jgi:hypothetical protein
MPTFQELFEQSAFQVYERQNRLAALVGERDWLLDTEAATLTFGEDLVFDVQFLGTASDESNTWLWADANDNVAFSPASLELCKKIREHGKTFGIEEFVADQFPFSDEVGKPTADTLAMVAVALGNTSAYYRGPHEAGAVYLLLNDPRIDALPALDKEAFVEAFNNLMWQPGNMKKMMVSYLAEQGCVEKDWDGTDLKCSLPTGEPISFRFKRTKGGGSSIRNG